MCRSQRGPGWLLGGRTRQTWAESKKGLWEPQARAVPGSDFSGY